jgi:predicted aldo/keto reductase-like oxidoreductase
MCQIQLNILDEEYQAGAEGLRYAHSKGIPVVIMEPLKGGKLAQNVPADIQAAWDGAPVKRSPQEWAFRWVANFPEVTVILSGSSTMEQLQDSIQIFETAAPNSLTEEELKIIQEVKNLYMSKIKVDCTSCNYCMPCPSGVNIPRLFQLYNDSAMYEIFDEYANHYEWFVKDDKDASQCVECGQCEDACPQNLPIIEKLKEVHAYFTR